MQAGFKVRLQMDLGHESHKSFVRTNDGIPREGISALPRLVVLVTATAPRNSRTLLANVLASKHAI